MNPLARKRNGVFVTLDPDGEVLADPYTPHGLPSLMTDTAVTSPDTASLSY